MRRNDVASTSFRRRVPIRFLINQCQIITFLILKYDIIENSRIELRGIVLPVQMGGLLGGGGGQRVRWPPPSQIIGGGPGPPLAPPLPTPMVMPVATEIISRAVATIDSQLKYTTLPIHWAQQHHSINIYRVSMATR